MKILPLKNDDFGPTRWRALSLELKLAEQARLHSNTKYIMFNAKFIMFNAKFIILNTKFIILNELKLGEQARLRSQATVDQTSTAAQHTLIVSKNDEFKIQNSKFKIQNSKFKIQNSKRGTLN